MSASSRLMPCILYVLRCGEEYYVGTTDNVEQRLTAHREGRGAEWTKRWAAQGRPIILVRRTPCGTEQEAHDAEMREAAQLLVNHGLSRVRGGPFIEANPVPPGPAVDQMVRDIGHVLNMDFAIVRQRLLSGTEPARQAPAAAAPPPPRPPPPFAPAPRPAAVTPPPLPPPRVPPPRPAAPLPRVRPPWVDAAERALQRRRYECGRCGRDHATRDCYASFHANGRPLVDDFGCRRCGRDHPTRDCYASSHANGRPLFDDGDESDSDDFY